MQIRIADYKEVYSVLDKAYLLDPAPALEGDEWRQGSENKEDLENMKKTAGYDLHLVELPYPLDGISLTFERNGKYYSGTAKLAARNCRVFRSLSSRLEGELSKKGMKFFATTSSGSGHICNETGMPLFSIMQPGTRTREIGFGIYGCVPRKFKDFSKFLDDIKGFESIINLYLSFPTILGE